MLKSVHYSQVLFAAFLVLIIFGLISIIFNQNNDSQALFPSLADFIIIR